MNNIRWAESNNKCKIEKEKNTVLPKLVERGLKIKEAKTEGYLVKKNGPEGWKKCKIRGSLIDTNKDIKRSKQLTNNAMKKLEHFRQQQPQHPSEDQSVQSMRRKHIPIQLGTMDADQNRKKEHQPSDNTKKGNKHQMAEENIK